MSSQRTSSLSQPSDECFAIDIHNFQECLPRLKEFLRKTDRQVQLRAVKTLLGPCVAFCPLVQLDKMLLDDATPVARRLFFESINEVDDLVSSTTFNVLDNIRERLEYCEDLLECWLGCLVQLGKIERLSASQARGVLENLVEVIKRSFEHCKESEENYGNLFEKAKERLTTLFRKTSEVQKLFSVILERVIVFSNDVEAELSVLAKVVSFAGETSLLVDGLGMKAMADSWKCFTRIATAYCNELKIFTPPCVTPHLAALADGISSSIASAVKDGDHRSAERSIKLQKLLVKILSKLCVSYSGYLGNDAASAVVRLLVQLHRYSPSCLKMLNTHLEIINCVEANFTSGIDQLLESVISDAEFKQAFFKYQATENSDDIGYHFLTLIIVNKLITTSSDAQICMWWKFPHNILEIAFANVNALEEEFFVGQLCLGILPIYDATLTSICGLVVSTRDEDFPSLEILLLKHLMGGNFWSSLMASDVWCFIDKFASSELGHDHLVYLMSVYEIITNRGPCMETVILGNLISRLYAMSLSETRNRLTDKFEITKARFWAPLRRGISKSDQTFLSELTCTDVENIATTWENLGKQPSAEVWSRLINQLTVIGTFGKPENEQVSKTLTAIWNCLGKSIDEFDGINLHLVTQLIKILLDATLQAVQNHDENLRSILSTLASLVTRSVPCIRACIANYLKESIDNFGKSGPELTKTVAHLYCRLLQDADPLSKQEALESFAHVTSTCYNEELVIGIVDAAAEVPEISDTVSLYLSQTAASNLRGFESTEIYLRALYKSYRDPAGNHVCLERGEPRREKKRRKLLIHDSIRPRTPEDLRERVKKLSEDVDYVLSRKQDMSESSLDKLEIIVNKILSSNETELFT